MAVQEPNPEEVCEVRWMSQDEVSAFCAPDATHGEQIACWFAEIENLVRPPNLPSRLSTPRVWLISYGLCSCFIRGGTIWTRWSRATRASSIGATCRTPSLDEGLEDTRHLSTSSQRARKKAGDEAARRRVGARH